MNNAIIQFHTGDIIINDKTIAFQSHNKLNKKQSLERVYIGAVNYEEYNYLRLSVFNYGIRFFIGGGSIAVISIIAQITTDNTLFNMIYWISILSTLFGAFLIFCESFIDLFLGTRIAINICNSLFGIKGYKISIQNTSGGDHIEFYINPDELEKAKDLIKHKLNQDSVNGTLGISLKELNGLLELKNKGIVTDEEFNQLKNQLFNK